MYQTNCRFFSGYKPCGFSEDCNENCLKKDIIVSRILIIHLGAMGAVLRSTALLPAIHKKHPRAHVTWVTASPMNQLLKSDPLIDRVLTLNSSDMLTLSALEFDFAYVIDKSLEASGVLRHTKADIVNGFISDIKTGTILPANPEALELWELGLSNQKKFYENKKTENKLMHEALNLGQYKRDSYRLIFSDNEATEIQRRSKLWRLNPNQFIIGFNTGCGPLMPAKKWSIDFHRALIKELLIRGYKNIVLLGGPDDDARNKAIAKNLPVILSSTQDGVRDGAISVAACDIVVTGDSFGMHLAIAAKKQVVAWFGPSCSHEIDLYDRGIMLNAKVNCSPCWKRSCNKENMCYDSVSELDVVNAIAKLEDKIMNQAENSKINIFL